MSPANPPVSAAGVGLGYGIAIAVSILVLISTIMLASYACVRVKATAAYRNRSVRSTYERNSSVPDLGVRSSEPMVVLVMGLDRPMIESYPKVVLGESLRFPSPNQGGVCSICLADYQPKDCLRCIPQCLHSFHADCIDEWLRVSGTCPLCRNSPAPSPSPTPLASPRSELAPLAFHARSFQVILPHTWWSA